MKPKVTTEFHQGEAKIFKNRFLESLTKTTPLSNIIIYGIAIVLAIYFAIIKIGIPPIVMVGLFIFFIVIIIFSFSSCQPDKPRNSETHCLAPG